MKKTTRKLRLSRETVHHLIADPSALRRAPGGTGLNSCQGEGTCPPACTRLVRCVG
jgi:hypothetical protein